MTRPFAAFYSSQIHKKKENPHEHHPVQESHKKQNRMRRLSLKVLFFTLPRLKAQEKD